jgi:hypothetical protein
MMQATDSRAGRERERVAVGSTERARDDGVDCGIVGWVCLGRLLVIRGESRQGADLSAEALPSAERRDLAF